MASLTVRASATATTLKIQLCLKPRIITYYEKDLRCKQASINCINNECIEEGVCAKTMFSISHTGSKNSSLFEASAAIVQQNTEGNSNSNVRKNGKCREGYNYGKLWVNLL